MSSASRFSQVVFVSFVLGAHALQSIGCITAARRDKAAGRITLGTAYLKEGNVPGAIEKLEEGAKLDRRNWAGWNKLGLAYMAAGAPDQAEEAFLKAIHIVPDEAEALTNYGTFLVRNGRPEEAIPVLTKAAKTLTYRKPAIPLSNLGYAYHLLDRNTEALANLDDAIRRAPNLCQARFMRGIVLDAMDRQPSALEDFEVVVQLCGEEAAGAYFQAGRLLLEQGRRNDGCTYLMTALQESGTSALGRQARELHGAECK